MPVKTGEIEAKVWLANVPADEVVREANAFAGRSILEIGRDALGQRDVRLNGKVVRPDQVVLGVRIKATNGSHRGAQIMVVSSMEVRSS